MPRNPHSNIAHLQDRVSRLWREYVDLRERAERSRCIHDGIAAGRAWARFLGEFTGPVFTADGGGR